jgi:type IV pilus assembly protein PilE
MIVVAIVGILAAVALPSYTEYVKRGNRASARAALMEAQQFMERFYAVNSRYTTDAAGTTSPDLPARLQNVPTELPRYTLSLSAPSLNSYTLTATPIVGTTDRCANLTLTSTGVKGTSSALGVAECWR